MDLSVVDISHFINLTVGVELILEVGSNIYDSGFEFSGANSSFLVIVIVFTFYICYSWIVSSW